jgi:hypothetical protein
LQTQQIEGCYTTVEVSAARIILGQLLRFLSPLGLRVVRQMVAI